MGTPASGGQKGCWQEKKLLVDTPPPASPPPLLIDPLQNPLITQRSMWGFWDRGRGWGKSGRLPPPSLTPAPAPAQQAAWTANPPQGVGCPQPCWEFRLPPLSPLLGTLPQGVGCHKRRTPQSVCISACLLKHPPPLALVCISFGYMTPRRERGGGDDTGDPPPPWGPRRPGRGSGSTPSRAPLWRISPATSWRTTRMFSSGCTPGTRCRLRPNIAHYGICPVP